MLSDQEQRLFEALPDLPDDLAEAFDGMKLAIMHHKRDGWRAISLRDVGQMLRILHDLADELPDLVETAKRASAKINAHDFKRIAGALGLLVSEETTIDAMVAKILELRERAG